jgi:hypothetical protein
MDDRPPAENRRAVLLYATFEQEGENVVNKVDTTAIKFGQAAIVLVLAMAFLFDLPWLVAALAALVGLGAAWPRAALFQQLYRQILRPLGVLRPRIVVDDPAPHRFAQGMGATLLALAGLLLLATDADVAGWALAGLVAVLAAVNLFFGFCAGCFAYYWLARLGILHKPRAMSQE